MAQNLQNPRQRNLQDSPAEVRSQEEFRLYYENRRMKQKEKPVKDIGNYKPAQKEE